MSDTELLVHLQEGILSLTIHRENRRNALSPTLLTLLRNALQQAEQDPAVRVVCLTGSGNRAFSSGADLLSSLQGDTSPMEASLAYARLLQDMLRFPKPIVARINGHAMGGGLGLVLACDIAIARQGTMFGTPEVNVGLFPFMISPLILQHMPRKRAIQMMFCGESLNTEEALQYGFINEIVPEEDLDRAVQHRLQKLLKAAPLAQYEGKQAIQQTMGMPFDQAVEILAGHLGKLLQSADAAEGIVAFMERREPNWQGK